MNIKNHLIAIAIVLLPSIANAAEIPDLKTESDSINFLRSYSSYESKLGDYNIPNDKRAFFDQVVKTYNSYMKSYINYEKRKFYLYSSIFPEIEENDNFIRDYIKDNDMIVEVRRGDEHISFKTESWRNDAASIALKIDEKNATINLAALEFFLSDDKKDKEKFDALSRECEKKALDKNFANLKSKEDSVSFACGYLEFKKFEKVPDSKNLNKRDYTDGIIYGFRKKKIYFEFDESSIPDNVSESFVVGATTGASVADKHEFTYIGGAYYMLNDYTPKWSEGSMKSYLKKNKTKIKGFDVPTIVERPLRKELKFAKGATVYRVDSIIQYDVNMVPDYAADGYITHFNVYQYGNKMGETRYKYNREGRNTKISDIENGGYERMVMWKEYDKKGQFTMKHRKEGHSKIRGERYSYDNEGRLTSKMTYLDGSPWSEDTITYSKKGVYIDSLGRELTTDTVISYEFWEGYLNYDKRYEENPNLEEKEFNKSIEYRDKNNNLVKAVHFKTSSKDTVSYVKEWVVDEYGDIVEVKINGETITTIEYDHTILMENIMGFEEISRSIFDGVIDFAPKHAVKTIKKGSRKRMVISYSKSPVDDSRKK